MHWLDAHCSIFFVGRGSAGLFPSLPKLSQQHCPPLITMSEPRFPVGRIMWCLWGLLRAPWQRPYNQIPCFLFFIFEEMWWQQKQGKEQTEWDYLYYYVVLEAVHTVSLTRHHKICTMPPKQKEGPLPSRPPDACFVNHSTTGVIWTGSQCIKVPIAMPAFLRSPPLHSQSGKKVLQQIILWCSQVSCGTQ